MKAATRGRVLTVACNGEFDQRDRQAVTIQSDWKDIGELCFAAVRLLAYVFKSAKIGMLELG